MIHLTHLLPSHHRSQVHRTTQPEALDPARPTVLQLPEPVVHRIFSFLSDDYLSAVALLSSSLYRVARSVQHRELKIDLDDGDHHALDRLDLVSRLEQFGAVRTLRVSAHKYRPGQDRADAVLACLATVIPSMTGLKDLHWHVDSIKSKDSQERMTTVIPTPILTSLPAEARLHTSVFCNEVEESHVHARVFLDVLAENKNLHAPSIRITFIQEQMCQDTMRPLKKVLLSCPKLTRIPYMNIWYPEGDCNAYGPSLHGAVYCGLGFVNGEKPQPLEELGIEYYPWGKEGRPQYLGYNGSGYADESDYWASVFDWSRLVRVNKNMATGLADSLSPRLTGVKELVLDDIHWLDAAFVDDIPASLELISIAGSNCISQPESIARFGATLRHLQIHQPGQMAHLLARGSNLEQLAKSLPHVEHLSVDVDPQQGAAHEWNYGILDAIAAFPSLRSVELWSPPGSALPSRAPAPILTADSARHLFDYMRERNDKILRATFHSGERHLDRPALRRQPVAVWGPGPEERPPWNELNAVTFECSVVYPVGEQGSRVDVTCPHLSLEMNLRLRRLEQQQKADGGLGDLKKLDPDEVRLRAALVGPLTQAEWKIWRTHYNRRAEIQNEKMAENTAMAKFVTGPLRRTLGR